MECPICFDTFNAQTLPSFTCGHSVCSRCGETLTRMLSRPMCRREGDAHSDYGDIQRMRIVMDDGTCRRRIFIVCVPSRLRRTLRLLRRRESTPEWDCVCANV